MTILLNELKDHLLQQSNEVEILELLDVSAEDLVEAFSDRVAEKHAFLVRELELEDEDT